MYGMTDRPQAVSRTLTDIGLQERQHQLAGTLSGGWKQRLALAACILHRPQLLLLDEPTAGVDPKARREFWEGIHALADQRHLGPGIDALHGRGRTLHRLAYIAYGKLLATGTPEDVRHMVRLSVWEVHGPLDKLAALAAVLRDMPDVAHVTAFGNTLHVAGEDAGALEKAVSPFRGEARLIWTHAEPGLEDVFINLMKDQVRQ